MPSAKNAETKLPRTCKRKPSTHKPRIEREDNRLFWGVVEAFHRLGFSEPLVSSNPNLTGRKKKRTATVADFVIDVESATQLALQGTGLLAQWHRLAKDNVRPVPGVMRQIIGLCSPVYRERGLQPDGYFKSSGRTGGLHSVHRTRAKSGARNSSRYRHRVVGTRAYCEEHGLQTVTGVSKDADEEILLLECGCKRRKDSEAAVAPSGSVSIATLPSHAFRPKRCARD